MQTKDGRFPGINAEASAELVANTMTDFAAHSLPQLRYQLQCLVGRELYGEVVDAYGELRDSHDLAEEAAGKDAYATVLFNFLYCGLFFLFIIIWLPPSPPFAYI